MAVLQVLTFGKHIGRNHHINFVLRPDALAVAFWAEPVYERGRVFCVARHAGNFFNPAYFQLLGNILCRVRKLREHENFFALVCFCDKLLD